MNEKCCGVFQIGSSLMVRGAATTNDYEVIRFTTQLGIAVLYRNKDGEITKRNQRGAGCFQRLS